MISFIYIYMYLHILLLSNFLKIVFPTPQIDPHNLISFPNFTHKILVRQRNYPARQNGDFGQNFHLFSAHFPPIFCRWYPIHRFSAHMFMDYSYFCLFPPIFRLFSTYFRQFFAYFLPEMVPHPYYKLKHITHLPFFRPHVYGFRIFSA